MHDHKNDKKDNRSYGLPIGMCIGIAIGTAIGAATQNMGTWMPVGLSVGMCIGLVLDHKNQMITKAIRTIISRHPAFNFLNQRQTGICAIDCWSIFHEIFLPISIRILCSSGPLLEYAYRSKPMIANPFF